MKEIKDKTLTNGHLMHVKDEQVKKIEGKTKTEGKQVIVCLDFGRKLAHVFSFWGDNPSVRFMSFSDLGT